MFRILKTFAAFIIMVGCAGVSPAAPSVAPEDTVCSGVVTAGHAHVPLTIDLITGGATEENGRDAINGPLRVSPSRFALSSSHPKQLIAIKDLGYHGSFGLLLKSCATSVELDFAGPAHGPTAHAVARIAK